MIQLRGDARWSIKKKLIITGATLVGVCMFTVAAWWLIANYSMGQYQKSLDDARQSTLQALAADTQHIKSAADDGQRLTAISTFASDAHTKLTNLPHLPVIFGFTAGGQQDKTTRAAIEFVIKNLANAADTAKQMAEYHVAVADTLKKVTSLSGKNAEEQTAMANAWATALATLRGMSPPEIAKNAHKELITVVAKVQAILAALPDVFTKKDANAFAEKQTALDAAVRELRALSGALTAAAQLQDKTVVTAYSRLHETLK